MHNQGRKGLRQPLKKNDEIAQIRFVTAPRRLYGIDGLDGVCVALVPLRDVDPVPGGSHGGMHAWLRTSSLHASPRSRPVVRLRNELQLGDPAGARRRAGPLLRGSPLDRNRTLYSGRRRAKLAQHRTGFGNSREIRQRIRALRRRIDRQNRRATRPLPKRRLPA